jgi:uncharacterized 2Fe-2S/4Fe-4S cluster protein (DUF4445 family)
MPKVRFEPSGIEVEVPAGTRLLAAADQAAQDFDGEFFYGECCEGRLECGNCLLEIIEGGDRLSPATEQEIELRTILGRGQSWRASCAAEITGNIVARVPPRPGTEQA